MGPPINPQKQKRGDIAQLRGSSGNGTMRNALPKNSRLKWDYIKDHDGKFVIPYVITGFYEKREKKIISEAMGKIDKNTCLRFKLRSHQKDYIEIQNKEGEGHEAHPRLFRVLVILISLFSSRCYSTVGRYGGKSVVMLEASRIGSCIQPEVVIHELLHVIGLWHEHMREDRDKYIKVHYENIQKGYENQFAKVLSPDAVTYGVPYDYLSIMHYEKTAFANPRTLSMEPLNPKYLNIIGKQKEPSKNDYLKVCFIYSCDVCMGKKVHLTTTTTRATAKPRPPNPDKRPSQRHIGNLPRGKRINFRSSRSGRIDKYSSLLQYAKPRSY
ncbi:astacin [Ancylostoma caninum]|uniref:Metalloendopeptidase n=1 Tax=Ancylostoma caninum TaxID=29170 RepID=A0A368GHZ2_ANCCA|nr:astacin [Ancylostoma caninum]